MPLIDTSDARSCALLGELVEAIRVHAIFITREARARPAEAWISLPLGLPLGDAVVHLSKLPEAYDDELHHQHREILRSRLADANTAWRLHLLGRSDALRTN